MKEEFDSIVFDLETFGTNLRAPIRSIAAVQFNLDTGKTGAEFKVTLDLNEQFKVYKRVPDWETIKWWLEQSDDSRKNFISEFGVSVKVAHEMLCFWLSNNFKSPGKVKVFGNGSKFDNGIQTSLFEEAGLDLPWNHRMERDVRTLVDFAPEVKEKTQFVGIKHDPIADCKHEIAYICAIKSGLTYTPPSDAIVYAEDYKPTFPFSSEGINRDRKEITKATDEVLAIPGAYMKVFSHEPALKYDVIEIENDIRIYIKLTGGSIGWHNFIYPNKNDILVFHTGNDCKAFEAVYIDKHSIDGSMILRIESIGQSSISNNTVIYKNLENPSIEKLNVISFPMRFSNSFPVLANNNGSKVDEGLIIKKEVIKITNFGVDAQEVLNKIVK